MTTAGTVRSFRRPLRALRRSRPRIWHVRQATYRTEHQRKTSLRRYAPSGSCIPPPRTATVVQALPSTSPSQEGIARSLPRFKRASAERHALDLRQLDGEGAPETAAVGGEVEPVPSRVEDEVGILLGDRDGSAARQAAARLAPGPAGVVRDDERRAALDDRDDGRPRGRGVHDERQRDGDGRAIRQLLVGAERHDRLVLEVDEVDAVHRADRGPHRERRARRLATSAVARRAAAAGTWPSEREARYATAKASPAPVGSVGAISCASTRCSRPSA